MRIEVLGEDSIGGQARSYAEYRLFAALAQVVDTNHVRHARLILRRRPQKRAWDNVGCEVTVAMDNGDTVRIRTFGDHPYAAINRAVERLQESDWPANVAHQPSVPRAAAE